jgi:D-alanyl-D-alanine carboxypeptidase
MSLRRLGYVGESPDRSIRTAGAEEQEAGGSTAETAVQTAVDAEATEQTEQHETAATAPTDAPTRTLRPRDAREEREETDAGGREPAAEAQAVDSETRVLRAAVIEKAPEAEAEAGEPKAAAVGDRETRVLRAVIGKTPKAERPEAAAEHSEAARPKAVASEVAQSEAAASKVAPSDAARSEDGDADEVTAEDQVDEESPAGEAAQAAPEPESASRREPESRPEPAPASAPESAHAPESALPREPDFESEPASASAPAPDTDSASEPETASSSGADTGADADSAREPGPASAREPLLADSASESGPAPAPDSAPEPPSAAGQPPSAPTPPPSLADEETRSMSALRPLRPLPPLPPPPGPARPAAAPSGAPGRGGAPAGATAVASSPETTVEAMEVLAGLSARPMTPARIALRRIRLYGTLLVLLVLILGTVQVLRPVPQPKLQQSTVSGYSFSGGALALDWPVKGQAAVSVPGLGLMGTSGSGNPVPLASVTKMMTAYIVLHDHPLKKGDPGPTITVDQGAVNDWATGSKSGESVQKVAAGEKLSEYQALQMLMIPSANNIARLLGRWDAGTDAAFVGKMQATAARLGMAQSTYTDPSGLDATTRSTAQDQLKLATAAMEDPVFREVVGTQSFNSPLNGPTPNTNTLVGKDGVIGIKTGTSTAALGNLVWAAEQTVGGVRQLIVGVTLSQPAIGGGPGQGILDQVLVNSKKLVLSAEQALQGHTIAHKGDVVGYVDDGLGGRTPVVATEDVQVTGWSGLSVDVSLRPLDGRAVPHSAAAGTVVGELVVGSGASAQTVPVALQSNLAAPGFGAKLTRLA